MSNIWECHYLTSFSSDSRENFLDNLHRWYYFIIWQTVWKPCQANLYTLAANIKSTSFFPPRTVNHLPGFTHTLCTQYEIAFQKRKLSFLTSIPSGAHTDGWILSSEPCLKSVDPSSQASGMNPLNLSSHLHTVTCEMEGIAFWSCCLTQTTLLLQ